LVTRIVVVRRISQEVDWLSQDTIKRIANTIPLTLTPAQKRSLDAVNKAALGETVKREGIWFSISNQHRFITIKILHELSKRIQREEIGLTLQQLTIHVETSSLILQGMVKDFGALRSLEHSLKESPLFKTVSNLQELHFTIKITFDITALEDESV
jgi:hypothetical protein